MTKNWEKKLQMKKKLNFFGSKTTIYLFLGIYKKRSSYRRSLQLSKEAIQHFKRRTFKYFFYFCESFLPSWIRIRNPGWRKLCRVGRVARGEEWAAAGGAAHRAGRPLRRFPSRQRERMYGKIQGTCFFRFPLVLSVFISRYVFCYSVLRIRDVYPGFEFFHPWSRIRIKEF